MLGKFLAAWVATQADLVALVGKRVSPWKSGQKEPLPRMVYFGVSGTSVKTLTRPRSLQRSRLQVEIHAEAYATARSIAEKLVGDPEASDNRLDGYAGTLGGVVVQGAHLDNDGELLDQPQHADDRGVYSVVLDFIFWWKPE